MKKVIRLTESDLHKIVKETVKEAIGGENTWHVQSQPYEHSEEETLVVANKLLNEIGANAMYDYLCRFIVSKYGPDALYNLLFSAIKKYTSIKWEFLTR